MRQRSIVVYSDDARLHARLQGLFAAGSMGLSAGMVTGTPLHEDATDDGPSLAVVDRPLLRMLPAGWRPRVLLVCDVVDAEAVVEAIERGAQGCILRDADAEHWRKAVDSVLAGQFWLPRDLMAHCLQMLLRGAAPDAQVSAAPANESLTERERAIMDCASRGLTNKEIGRRLGISPATVKTHLHHIFAKLQVTRRVMLGRGAALRATKVSASGWSAS